MSKALSQRLSRPVRTTARRQYATINSQQSDPAELDQITTLPNGLRIATEALPGSFSGIGVYIDGGSRYETDVSTYFSAATLDLS
ncbi:Mitochondrial-processing peptidase subunit alpha [Elasticomyces elasticus]|nr:Mitochondrial-processing peptidase subunit alpha [Elasticomyces elasticus]